MARVARKFMAHYIDAAAPEDFDELFELMGDGLEEYSPEMSAQVTKIRNILGETDIIISGYEKTGEVATYYADPNTELHDRLQSIVEQNKVLDSLGTRIIDVYMWKNKNQFGYPAVLEYAFIEVKSYGGDASGLQIPYTIHYTGKKHWGYFDPENRHFTPEEETEGM